MIDQLKKLNPPDSSITSKLKDLEGNSSNTTLFQKKFSKIFNDIDVHQYIHSCFETIKNLDLPMAKLSVILCGNSRDSFPSSPVNAHLELERVSNFLANDITMDVSIR